MVDRCYRLLKCWLLSALLLPTLFVSCVSRSSSSLSSSPLTTTTTTLSKNNQNHRRRRNAQLLPQWSQQIVAGGASRSFAQAVLYPIDALRTLAQTRDGRTLADVGSGVLVRGCLTTSSFALFQGAIQFGVFEAVKPRCGPLLASAVGAAGSCVVGVPQEVVKQRLVTGVYGGFREAVATIWNTEGPRGFYSAWRPTVSRNVPFVVTTFTTRDVLRKRIATARRARQTQHGDNRGSSSVESSFSALENTAIGITSALVAGIVTHPIDFIKTRMMTQASSSAAPYNSALDCATTVLKTEGWMKFYSGFPQRSVYMCGLWGITFALNGHFNNKMKQQNETEKKTKNGRRPRMVCQRNNKEGDLTLSIRYRARVV